MIQELPPFLLYLCNYDVFWFKNCHLFCYMCVIMMYFYSRTFFASISLFTRLQVVDFPNWICALPKLNLVEAKTPTSWKFCSGQGTRGGGEGAVPQVPRQVHRRKLPQEGRTDITLENFPLRILQSKGMFGFNLVKMEGKVRENRACNWICLFRSLKKTQQAMRFPAGKGKC